MIWNRLSGKPAKRVEKGSAKGPPDNNQATRIEGGHQNPTSLLLISANFILIDHFP